MKIEKIDISKIRGEWIESGEVGSKYEHVAIAVGNDTIKSIKIVAEKINEIIETCNEN